MGERKALVDRAHWSSFTRGEEVTLSDFGCRLRADDFDVTPFGRPFDPSRPYTQSIFLSRQALQML